MNITQTLTVTVCAPTVSDYNRLRSDLIRVTLGSGEMNGSLALLTDDAGLDVLIDGLINARDAMRNVAPALAVVK